MSRRIFLGAIVVVLLSVPMRLAASVADPVVSVAAMNGDIAEVRNLLSQKVDVNVPQGDGTTALHWAAYREDLEMAQLLIKAGADAKARTRLGEMTPLFMAAKTGNVAMVDLLLKAGAPAKSATTLGTTPLMLAASSGSAAVVRTLLAAGADPNAKDVNQGQTALIFAAAAGNAEAVRALAAGGARVNETSLVPDAKKVEASAGSTLRKNELALGGMSALHFAAREGKTAAIEALLEAKADANLPTASNRMSALTIAILSGHFDLARFLLEHGADPKLTSKEGLGPMFAVIDAQWANRVWYPPPVTDEEHTTYLGLLRLMLARGADPNVRLGVKMWQREFHNDWVDSAGGTAFWRASQANDVLAMRLLVAGGANPTIPSFKGVSPLQVAAGWGFEPQTSTFVPDARLNAIRYLVEELGAVVNAKDDKGYTALHAAGLTADNRVIRYLVAMGADVQSKANLIFGGEGAADSIVPPGTGDSVADMANGPKPHNLVQPEALSLLEALGSKNAGNCRASTCVIKVKPVAKPGGQY